jgi:hypothetical protein
MQCELALTNPEAEVQKCINNETARLLKIVVSKIWGI